MIKMAPVVRPQEFYSSIQFPKNAWNYKHCHFGTLLPQLDASWYSEGPCYLEFMPYLNCKFLNILKCHKIYVPKIVWNNQKRYADELHLIQLLHSSGYPQYPAILFQGSFLFKLQEAVSWYQIRWMMRVADHYAMVCQEMLQYHGRISSSVRMCGRNFVQTSTFPNLYEELDK